MDFKRLIIAIKKTILAFAILHLILLLLYSVSTGQYVYLNLASILDLQLFFKNLQYTRVVGLMSFIPVLIVIWINYKRTKQD